MCETGLLEVRHLEKRCPSLSAGNTKRRGPADVIKMLKPRRKGELVHTTTTFRSAAC